MKILLLGGNGQVGWELQRALAPLGDLTVLGREENAGLCGDLERPDALRESLQRLKPRIIVNAAAHTNVDRAETEADQARRLNAEAPGLLAAEAARLGAWLVHYSTDYVFDGGGTAPWRESDTPAPVSAYGTTKLEGERAVREAGCKHLLFRTQWVYAARGMNFLRTILHAAAEKDALRVVDDQHGAPTGAELIADVTAHALRAAMHDSVLSGTYHLAARGETTWFAYARFVIERARDLGWPVRVADAAIVPVGTDEFHTAARRPLNSRLDVERLERTFDLRLPQWHAGVARAVAELCAGRTS